MHNRISLLRRIITFNVQLLSHNKNLAVIRKYISESQIKQDKNFYKDLHKNVFVKFPSLIKLYLVSDPEIKKKEKVENVEMQGYEEGKNIDVEMQEKEDEYNGEVKRIIRGLKKASNPEQLCNLLHGIFVDMFDERLAGPKENYQQLAIDIFKLK